MLLAAIARSDGTRASVIHQLFRVRIEDSLVGDVAFDARGDLAVATLTVLRVVGGKTTTNSSSVDGAVVEAVLHPELRLVERESGG